MFNEHKKFPKIRGYHNIVKEIKSFCYGGVYPTQTFRAKVKLHGCVSGETLVLMGDGTEKYMFELNRGDVIKSYNINTNEFENDVIQNVLSDNLGKDWVKLTFECGREINCTEDHPILTLNRGYVAALELSDSDIVVGTKNG